MGSHLLRYMLPHPLLRQPQSCHIFGAPPHPTFHHPLVASVYSHISRFSFCLTLSFLCIPHMSEAVSGHNGGHPGTSDLCVQNGCWLLPHEDRTHLVRKVFKSMCARERSKHVVYNTHLKVAVPWWVNMQPNGVGPRWVHCEAWELATWLEAPFDKKLGEE